MKKVEELKDLGCSVRGRFYDLAWSKPVLRAPAVHGVSSNIIYFLNNYSTAMNQGNKSQCTGFLKTVGNMVMMCSTGTSTVLVCEQKTHMIIINSIWQV